ncbi:MAG: polynucleotide kinase-phosphatase, partial [Candidatus Sericytochromatia bacterium]
GLPVRLDWAAEYRGPAMVVYGHVPVPEPEWVNHTIDIDNGCCFGGKLTALRYPEQELVSVPAAQVYYEPIKPMLTASDSRSTQQQLDDILDWSEVAGKQHIPTRLQRSVTIQAEQSAAALEIISRFAVDPKWLIYLPPTMSPSETAAQPEYLEYPSEAFAYFRRQGVKQVICEQKHMGSRALLVVCREPEVACTRFGLSEAAAGSVFTRTGRPFFKERQLAEALLDAARQAIAEAGLWEDLHTDWLLLDAEIMPWSAKAGDLLQKQYAAVGAAAAAALGELVPALGKAAGRLPELSGLLEKQQQRQQLVQQYIQAYRGYCWPVAGLADMKIAPFHLLASEGQVHADKPHAWHLAHLARLADANPAIFMATAHHVVDLDDEASELAATEWWLELTGAGGEGMVIKPVDFLVKGPKGYVQPALKCRGREYLRIIYGPDYSLPDNLIRLKQRGLSAKRTLAMREFALGLEALDRFVQREPLRKVHACVAGVLALESEPVDPRL